MSNLHNTAILTDGKRTTTNDNKRNSIFPSLKKTFYDNGRMLGRVNEFSLDEKAYRMTSNQIIKGLARHNDNQIKKLRETFVKVIGTNSQKRKKIGAYTIVRELGKGGFAQVWEVQDASHRRYALKEYNLQNSVECFQNEANIGSFFFEGGSLRPSFRNHLGSPHLIAFVDKFRQGKFGYIVQELSQHNLSKMISDIQGVFHNNQRIYEVRFKEFHGELVNKGRLSEIMMEICKGLSLINGAGFIHCDLKLENIMVQIQGDRPVVKIIDFGSTFELKYGLPKITITPEYMPPELLAMLQSGATNYDILGKVDVWSVGCILLEIITGVPLWFRYKCRVEVKGRPTVQLGIFALTGRDYQKIIKKQRELAENIHKIPITHKEFEIYRPILKKILVFNPQKRLDIDQCISLFQQIEETE